MVDGVYVALESTQREVILAAAPAMRESSKPSGRASARGAIVARHQFTSGP
jgi:hypothetical protein